jgi:LPS export ABC transporter protein LptC
MSILSRVFAVLVFVVVIGGTIFFGGQQNLTTVPTIVEEPHDPGYAARDARLIQTGQDGRPLYTIDADVIRQQPNDNTIQLEKATLGFFDANGSLWTARGNQGEVGQDTREVDLSGDVHVNGTPEGTLQPVEIVTEHLQFDTNSKIATTKDPVTFTWSGQEMRGKGMRATLNDWRMQLESAVHIIAAPSRLPSAQK